MSKKDPSQLILLIGILILIAGFYMNLRAINNVNEKVQNLKSQVQLIADKVVEGRKSTSTQDSTPDFTGNTIQTAILFKTQSSPLLTPQTELTVSLEEITLADDGRVSVGIKVFSDQADSYSALEPSNLFELVNLQSENQKPLKVNGTFDAIPPQSSTEGSVIFKTEQSAEEIILQVDTKQGPQHYRFNFKNGSYEKAVLG